MNQPAPPPPVVLPKPDTSLLLHVCCAPCGAHILTRLQDSGVDFAVHFYNPNIHPADEYLKRKSELTGFLNTHNIRFIDDDYDDNRWFELTKNLEHEPERGARCSVCFFMRMQRTAQRAVDRGFSYIDTTLSLSRYKDLNQVHTAAQKACATTGDHVSPLGYNWRKKDGSRLADQFANDHGFYRQNYCGCIYSKR